ncbi:MAG: signal peptidase I [Phytoplasma sp.]|uniref:signal peptidase I n=1 Tax=Phytoplasma sp. TaxID=2155 RepID=UPI002B403B56|nr:signal peptidase I [Phytoplasma sp.]WRH06947.1 MAG: signal peptidase I [Phytoplasma sp.]
MFRNKIIIKTIIYYVFRTILFLINSAVNIFILYLFLMFLGKFFLSPQKNISFFKFDIYRVASESMEQHINKGDYVVIKHLSDSDKHKLKQGDIVIFSNSRFPNSISPTGVIYPIIHRVVENNVVLQRIQTKGDNNDEIDYYPTDYEGVFATYFIHFNFISLMLMMFIFIPFMLLMSYAPSFLKKLLLL